MHTPPTKAIAGGALALSLVLEGAAARAQDNTGADRPTTAPTTESSGAKANGVYPPPAQGVERGAAASQAAQTTRTTHSSNPKPHRASKPVAGAANAPAAASGGDAKE
ncbi:hypothetical protein [Paraburkholderia sp. J76]|uniref:hypothetical protein n=1 Tax=Paraburkholderia sp. J76 TaxID=2805439 RepID=UPI002ABD9406|nr:hypothetical protein [Paraburkholderia sp. J76]